MKSNRRKAREDALQILYQLELNQPLSVTSALEHFSNLYSKESGEVVPFAKRLVVGVSEKQKEIDQELAQLSAHWKPERMAAVDKNILRLGAYEIIYCDDIPAVVSVNEMIELAKEFGAEQSAAFVNGILDQLKAKFASVKKAP